MCGIIGFVGKSKNIDLSYDLVTKVFAETDSRGIDASGFWSFNTKTSYCKVPIKSSKFIHSDYWKLNNDKSINILLAHARGASAGYGDPVLNKNNHPFVSSDLSLVHNGRLSNKEYNLFKNKYKLNTECDSELLLKIILGEKSVIKGIERIFSILKQSEMAVALADIKSTPSVWLFRNNFRPLWILDLKELLGQTFFFSDPDILFKVINNNKNLKFLKKYCKVYNLPPYDILNISEDTIYNYKIEIDSSVEISLKDFFIRSPIEKDIANNLIDYKDFNDFFENVLNIKKKQDYFNDSLRNIVKDFNDKIKNVT